jgi:hypothetical protein
MPWLQCRSPGMVQHGSVYDASKARQNCASPRSSGCGSSLPTNATSVPHCSPDGLPSVAATRHLPGSCTVDSAQSSDPVTRQLTSPGSVTVAFRSLLRLWLLCVRYLCYPDELKGARCRPLNSANHVRPARILSWGTPSLMAISRALLMKLASFTRMPMPCRWITYCTSFSSTSLMNYGSGPGRVTEVSQPLWYRVFSVFSFVPMSRAAWTNEPCLPA